MKQYVKNLETGKIELHFEKDEYQALTAEQKTELKRFFLWSRFAQAWVSKSAKDHFHAVRIAEKLGFTGEEKRGERLSFAETVERKQERAERKAERYEQYAENAEKRGKAMQTELERYHGDIAFFTQPIIPGHSGSEAFARSRDRIMNRYHKGFDEYAKSEYYANRAEAARATAQSQEFSDPVYLNNRIEEAQANIRRFERAIAQAEKTGNQSWKEELIAKLQFETDKLSYFKDCLAKTGTPLEEKRVFTREEIKPGYLINVGGCWNKVLKTNPKTVQYESLEERFKGYKCLCYYADIKDLQIPENWVEETVQVGNPFVVGDIVVTTYTDNNRIADAFQIVKTTGQTVTIRRIRVQSGAPVPNAFVSDKQERHSVKLDRSGKIAVNGQHNYLYKYTA
ncbi:hypothetical protein CEB3_c13420 [Peptococcaceae bacterium CEB3]|nr:hypothetical protein CEB3_c13420 [Peptococcaceae bacterium CEB3]